jgi:hypothetical protein
MISKFSMPPPSSRWKWQENTILVCTLAWGRKPIEVAPLIFSSSKRKNWKVTQALHGNAWVDKVDLEQDFTMEHLSQFVEL